MSTLQKAVEHHNPNIIVTGQPKTNFPLHNLKNLDAKIIARASELELRISREKYLPIYFKFHSL